MRSVIMSIVAVLGMMCLAATALRAADARPNIVYIVSDELGYYEPGFMGNRNLKTPHLDRLAAEGVVFRNLLAGSSVCAPTRCCLLTGKHSGHTSVRANGGGTPLRADEVTIAGMLKQQGYATGGFGKWGCGGRDSTGVPEKQGFDVFLGYYDQVHAHTYYPPYLIRNSEEVPLAGNRGGSEGQTYSQYVIHEAALKFLREHAQEPFFAYLPYTPPHGNFDIPDSDPAWAIYKDKTWPEPARRYAAMVTMLDRQLGEIFALLKELGIDNDTIVFFSGDNGGADYFVTAEHPRGIHSANRNPLTGMRGAVQLLTRGSAGGPLEPRQLHMLRVVDESVERMLAMVNQILEFTRLRARLMPIERQPVDLAKVVARTIDEMHPQAEEAGLTLSSTTSGSDFTVHADEAGLMRVVTNLVGNAVKFTASGEVVVRVLPEPAPAAPLTLRFEVEDTGVGIAPEVQSRLFQAFTQADGSITRRFGGTGLGLAISKQLVELMGGRVGLSSEPGRGSLFWFTLPFSPAETPPQTRRDDTPDAWAGLRVLVLEPLGLVGIWRRVQTYFLMWPFKYRPMVRRPR